MLLLVLFIVAWFSNCLGVISEKRKLDTWKELLYWCIFCLILLMLEKPLETFLQIPQ